MLLDGELPWLHRVRLASGEQDWWQGRFWTVRDGGALRWGLERKEASKGDYRGMSGHQGAVHSNQ